ncbi:peroxisomal membrane protein [Aureococcus anophagefferens]|uniref:Peroxisomal membrane protein n=1 Tax=Aureococcus anophagefferens TaxID=44056 RepID=A0ABR1FU25_AURAN
MQAARSFAAWYDAHLTTSPIVTKSVTSCGLFGVGDGLAQGIEGGEAVDGGRLARMMTFGGLVATPSHHWYNFLDRLVTGAGGGAVARKVLLDQLTWTPVMTFSFFNFQNVCGGMAVSESVPDASGKLLPTLKVNWVVWPFVHVVTFGAVPLPYRILWINCCSCFWSAYLSLQAKS